MDPLGQHQAGEDQDHNDRHEHIDQQMSRDQRIDLRDDKYAARWSGADAHRAEHAVFDENASPYRVTEGPEAPGVR